MMKLEIMTCINVCRLRYKIVGIFISCTVFWWKIRARAAINIAGPICSGANDYELQAQFFDTHNTTVKNTPVF